MIIKKENEDGTWWWPEIDITEVWQGQNKTLNVPDLISEHVLEKNVVIQAGGNCGLYTHKYSKIFKMVYTFEPFPELFRCLVMNTPENVIKFQGVLGNKHELVSINPHFCGDLGGGHVAGDNKIIPTFLIDDLCLSECDLIHLDIEGYEPFALEGARNTIERLHPVICVECYEGWLNRYGKSISDIDFFLYSLGYSRKCEIVNGDILYTHSG
jgi:FkbM family methyltransferase